MTDLPEEVMRKARDQAQPLLLQMAAALPAEPDYEGRAKAVNGAIDAMFDYVRSALTAEGYMVVPVVNSVFSPDEVLSLSAHQTGGQCHPFTCPNRGDDAHRGEGELVATINGWICPYCDYRQDWAHDFMKAAPTHYAPLLPTPETE